MPRKTSLKAFLVTEPEENTGGIVFARSDIEARKDGANEWNDGQLRGMSCKRAPWADKYAKTGVPARELIGMGWWFECVNCGENINEDFLDENDLPLDGVIGTQHSHVFCCDICEAQHQLSKVIRKHHERRMIKVMTARLLKRFPDIEIATEGNWAPHAYARECDGVVSVDQAVVSFKFPGMKVGPASYRFDRDFHTIGPIKPHLVCCNGDREVFELWANSVVPA